MRNLKFFRVRAGLSLPELAKRAGIKQMTLFRWEAKRGKWEERGGGVPSPELLQKLAQALGVSTKELLGHEVRNHASGTNTSTTPGRGGRKLCHQAIAELLDKHLPRRDLRAAIIDTCIKHGYIRQEAIKVADQHTRGDVPVGRPLSKPIREEQTYKDPGIQYTSAQIDQLIGNWKRKTAQATIRPQQVIFRKMVLEAYGATCAVTGSTETKVLDAAHIVPYCGPLSDQISNGICLRTDIHKLYDAGLISFASDFRIHVSNRVGDERYRIYHGQPLRLPVKRNDWPKLVPPKSSEAT